MEKRKRRRGDKVGFNRTPKAGGWGTGRKKVWFEADVFFRKEGGGGLEKVNEF